MTILGKVGELPSVCGRWPWPASVVSAGRWRPLHRPPPPSFPPHHLRHLRAKRGNLDRLGWADVLLCTPVPRRN